MNYQQPAYQPQNNRQPQYPPQPPQQYPSPGQYPQQPQQQQPVAQPFTGELEVSDASADPIADGRHPIQLTRLETREGINYERTAPQTKLLWIFAILSGPEQGKEHWEWSNLPEPGKKLGKKSKIRSIVELLIGRVLSDREVIRPQEYIGLSGLGDIRDGKLFYFTPDPPRAEVQQPIAQPQQQPATFVEQDYRPPQPVQPQQQVLQQPPVAQPQYDAYAEQIPQTPPVEHPETQRQAVERI